MPSIIVISCRSGVVEPGSPEWNLINSRNTALSQLGCDVKMYCWVPDIKQIPKHLLINTYQINFFTTKITNRIRFRFINIPDSILSEIYNISPNAILLTGFYWNPNIINKFPKISSTILDIHGSIVDTVNYGSKSRYFIFLKRLIFDIFWYRKIDGAIVVTDYLGNECRSIPGCKNLKTFTVPCASLNNPTWEEIISDRNRYRKLLGIKNNHFLLIQSGGLGQYQDIEPMVNLLQELLKQNKNIYLLLATPKVSLAERLLLKYPQRIQCHVIIKNFPDNEHFKVLAAGDAGLLLREDNKTNRAAFPNKTDEYWSVGLPVITTNGLDAVANMIKVNAFLGIVLKKYNGGLHYDEIKWFKALTNSNTDEKKERFKQIQQFRSSISFSTTLKPFVSFISRENY